MSRTPRVYAPQAYTIDQVLTLTPEKSRHLCAALKLKVGESVILFDGLGQSVEATLTQSSPTACEVRVTRELSEASESPLRIHLVQAVAKRERMDFIMQKAVELGARSITPLLTERVEVRLDAKRWQKKQQHWQGVLSHAAEQSGRVYVPSLAQPIKLERWLNLNQLLAFYLNPRANEALTPTSHGKPNELALLIGPEGGFSSSETALIEEFGGKGVALGPRILRTETAGLCAMSILQWCWGDLGLV